MSLYQPEVVTLWVAKSPDEQVLLNALRSIYNEDGEVALSPFAAAFRLSWYDEDFTELHFGRPARELLLEAAETWRTLDEQALHRLPAGEWNGLYILTGGAGEEWTSPNARPPMPHGEVRLGEAVFKLVDTFHVLHRPA